jgi:uncharacterized membrane protein YfbV (UPF0208 family)
MAIPVIDYREDVYEKLKEEEDELAFVPKARPSLDDLHRALKKAVKR